MTVTMVEAIRHAAVHLLGLAGLAFLFHATGVLLVGRLPALARWQTRVPLLPISLGIAAWIYGLFALAAVGALRTPIVLGIAAAVLAARGVAVIGRLRAPGRPRWLGDQAWRAHALTLVAPALVAGAVVVHALGPAPGWDAEAYHLAVPKLWIAHGGFRYVPYNVFSNWPLNIELLFGLALMIDGHVLAKLVHVLFLLTLLAALHRFTARAASPEAGSVAVALLLANPTLVAEARLAYVDVGLALFALMAFVSLVAYLETRDRAALVLCGLFCGVAAGSKLSGAFVAMASLPILWANRAPGSRAWRAAAGDTLVLGGLALALALPWYVKSYAYTGNPVYPMLFDVFGGRDWSAVLHRQFVEWQWSVGPGRAPIDYLLLPVRVVLGADRLGGSVSRAWLVAVPIALLAAPFIVSVRRCLAFAGAYFVLWAMTPQVVRYLIPVLPLCAAAAAISLWAGVRSLGARPAGPTAPATAHGRRAGLVPALVALLVVGSQMWLLASAGPMLRATAAEARALLRQEGRLPPRVLPRAYRYVNRHLPDSARVMLLNSNQGYFLERPYVCDSFFQASQMNALLLEDPTAEGIGRTLNRLGVTHVLWWSRNWRIRYPPALVEFLSDPTHARLLHRSDDTEGYEYLLFEVRSDRR